MTSGHPHKQITDETRMIEAEIGKHFTKVEAYRYNSVSIRVRVTDPRFKGLSHPKRYDLVEPYFDQLPEETQNDLLNTTFVTEEELDPLRFENLVAEDSFDRPTYTDDMLGKGNENQSLGFIVRVLRVFDRFDGEGDELLWRHEPNNSCPLQFFVNCSDVFAWGGSDCEEITPDNLEILEQAAADLRAIKGGAGIHVYDLSVLFAARVRKERPQGAYYANVETETRPLLDACGPEREVGVGNPMTPEQAIARKQVKVRPND